MAAVTELASAVGTVPLAVRCLCLGLPSIGIGVRLLFRCGAGCGRLPARALESEERETVLAPAGERFQDRSPAAINATLLDEGHYHSRFGPCIASWKNRANPASAAISCPSAIPEAGAAGHHAQSALELGHHQAARPSQVDLFLSLRNFRCFQPLRCRLDGGPRESAELAKKLIEETYEKQNVEPGQLGLDADRGSAMRSKPVALLLADLSVTKTHSRPASPTTIHIRKASSAP